VISLALRSLLWTLLLPGVVAGYVPLRLFGVAQVHIRLTSPLPVVGLAAIAAGTALLAACIWEFARSGHGTLSPVDPPRALVVRGLYRYVRNPMYLSVTVILLGEVLLGQSRPLLIYWGAWFAIVNVFVIGYEEPTLRRRFGESYERYAREVGRWVPTRPSRRPSP
jgi:protein-S-isoprenylcysteine O-methyltransferase Ste14